MATNQWQMALKQNSWTKMALGSTHPFQGERENDHSALCLAVNHNFHWKSRCIHWLSLNRLRKVVWWTVMMKVSRRRRRTSSFCDLVLLPLSFSLTLSFSLSPSLSPLSPSLIFHSSNHTPLKLPTVFRFRVHSIELWLLVDVGMVLYCHRHSLKCPYFHTHTCIQIFGTPAAVAGHLVLREGGFNEHQLVKQSSR